MKKLISIICLLAMVLSVLASCGGGKNPFIDAGEDIDTDKTQLYISNWDGGIGTEWLNRAAAAFEARYADYEFEPGSGKKGVQIIIDPNKDNRFETEADMPTSSNAIYFTERVNYYKWAKDGLLLDISDLVAETMSEYGENTTIANKLDDEMNDALQVNGKYYGLPHYEGFNGVIYNVDVFDSYLLYFNERGGFISNISDKRSAGPDGVSGTADDGLPATIEQFSELCEYMTTVGVTPFVWTGQNSDYFNILADALVTAQVGSDVRNAYYDFNGAEVEVITGFNGETPITETVQLTEKNGYYLWQMSAVYNAVKFCHEVIDSGNGGKPWYSAGSVKPNYSQFDAQADFVNSVFDNAPIAMMIEGNYWVNEAKDAIALSEKENSYNFKNDSNFAWMPLPGTVSGDNGNAELVLKDSLNAYCLINGNLAGNDNMIKLAKMFVKFCYTDAQLKDFTLTTGVTRNVNYELSESELAQLNSYARSMWNYRQTAKIVNTRSTNAVHMNSEDDLLYTFWKSQCAGVTHERVYVAFYNGGVSAKDYFMGLREYRTPNMWDASNRQYYSQED